jgi:hypothetical protein
MGGEQTSWQSGLAAFRARPGRGAWNLDRARVAGDLEAAITEPDAVDQGAFGFCGIAAFLRCWARRDPDAFTRFAADLYEHGAAAFTGYKVNPNPSLRAHDYEAAFATGKTRCPPGLWMVMGSIQDSISLAGFDGTVDRSWYSFLCLHEGAIPFQIAKLFADTRCYTSIDNRTDWQAIILPRLWFLPNRWQPSIGDARSLTPGPSCDVVLQINDVILHGGSPAPKGLPGAIGEEFPNHFVALASPVSVSGDDVGLRVWTWGGFQDLEMPVKRFMDNYYGAIVCTA